MSEKEAHRETPKQILIYQAPLVVYAAVIYIVSSMGKLPTPDMGLNFADKIIHVVEYGIFCYLALRALHNPPLALSTPATIFLAVSITIVYAALDEYHQSFVPGRNADIHDFGADTFGAIIAVLVYYGTKRRRSMSR